MLEKLKKEGLKVRLLGFQIMEDAVCLPENPVGYASALYAALHDLDAMGLDRIVIALPPEYPPMACHQGSLKPRSNCCRLDQPSWCVKTLSAKSEPATNFKRC